MKTISFDAPYRNQTKQLTFAVVSGVVLDTDQRSETHVHGHGSSMTWKGSGGGSMSVSSHTTVQRDIWLQEPDGKEHHLRFNFDLPVRAGQTLHYVTLVGGDDIVKNKIQEYALINANTGQMYWLADVDKKLNHPRNLLVSPSTWIGFSWCIRVFICTIFYVIPGILAYFYAKNAVINEVLDPVYEQIDAQFDQIHAQFADHILPPSRSASAEVLLQPA